MRWIRIGLACAGVLLAAIAILAVLLFTIDLGRFKPQVEALVSDQLGREFRIQGLFRPSLGRQVHFIAEGIELANAEWASEDSLLLVQKLDITLDTWSLLSGRILIENIELDDIAIHLEQDGSGLDNWTLVEAEETDDTGPSLNLLIRQARIRDFAVTYVDPALDSPIRFHASEIEQVQLDSGDLQLDLDGDLNGVPVTLDGTAGTFANLLDAGQVHYELRGAIGEISINSNAQIDSLTEPRKPVGQLEISGPDAKYVTDILGIEPVTRGPLDLLATMKSTTDKMNLGIQGEFGEFEIDVVGSFADLQDLEELDIEFSAGGPNAASLGKLAGRNDIPADPYAIAGMITRKGDAIVAENVAIEIGETAFKLNATIAEFPGLDGSVVSLTIDGPDFGRFNKLFGLPGKLTGPFSLTADLSQSPEGKELVDIAAVARDIQVKVNGMVSTSPALVGTELALSLKGDDLSVITAALAIPDVPGVPFNVNANVARVERGFTIDEGIVNLGNDVIQVGGLIGIEPLESDTDLRFQVSGPDLARTLNMAGVELENLPPGSYEAAGRIHRDPESFRLTDITARLGATRARLSGRLGNLTDFQGTDINITIEGDSLAGLVPEHSGYAVAEEPFDVSSNVQWGQDTLALRKLTVRIGGGELRGDISTNMSPMLSSGSIKVTAKGPDLAQWVPGSSRYVPTSAPFDLNSRARWQDTNVTIDQLTLKLGNDQLVASGEVNVVTDLARTDLNLDVQLASMSNLGRIAGTDLPDEPLTLSAHLIGSGTGLRLEDLRSASGKSDLSGSASYENKGDIPFLGLTLASKYLNLAPFLPDEEEGAESESTPPPADDSRVIPDTPIPMDRLKQLNARVDISIGELVLRETTVNDVVLDASLQDGALRVAEFGVADARGTLAGTLEVLPAAQGAQVSTAVDGTRLTLGLTPSSPDAVDLLPTYDVELKLAGGGATIREMAASLDGTLRLVGGSGQMKGIAGWFMRDFFSEIVEAVNPYSKKDRYAQVQCIAVLLRSVDGQVDGQPALVLQTDKLDIFGVAFVDLGTEEIDVHFQTAARTGIGIGVSDLVTPFIKISGTMANPSLALDTEETIVQGSVAVATAGLSFFAGKVKDRFFSAKDPCGKEVLKADDEMRTQQQ